MNQTTIRKIFRVIAAITKSIFKIFGVMVAGAIAATWGTNVGASVQHKIIEDTLGTHKKR